MSNDITLRRDHQSAIGPDVSEKRQWDSENRTEELQKQIYNL